MGLKDLSVVKEIIRFMDIGVLLLKIEGCMKLLYYIVIVVNMYCCIIDEYIEIGVIKNYEIYEEMLKNVENREIFYGFFYGLFIKD